MLKTKRKQNKWQKCCVIPILYGYDQIQIPKDDFKIWIFPIE